MLDPNKKEQATPTHADPDWEQEKIIWEACKRGDVSNDDSVSLDAFKALMAEMVENKK